MSTRSTFVTSLIILSILAMSIGSARDSVAAEALPTPGELWARCQKTLPPFAYDVVKDEVVASDTDPRLKLRRMEVRFVSQEVNGVKMGHDAVLFIPADPSVNASPKRRGKVVVVARNYSDHTLVGNCAEPIAARTGYPTMCVDIPGDKDGKEGEMYWLTGLRTLARDTHDPMNFDLFRCAVPFVRALDVFADVLKEKKIRAIIGGHSKRGYYAYTAAAIDPERVAGVVYLGCERLFTNDEKYPDVSVSPFFSKDEKYPKCLVPFTTQKYVKCPVLYLGATNEAGFTMFNINELVGRMNDPWTIEYIPNYRHASRSEKQFIDWQMWVAHVFDGRPITKIGNLKAEKMPKSTVFRADVESPNKILQVKLWYVYCDDVPYWRDLMWYPALMRKGDGNRYEARLGGNPPDAWFVEVKDIAGGFPGFVSSLPQNLTGKPAKERNARRPRNWAMQSAAVASNMTSSPEAYRHFVEARKLRDHGLRDQAIASYRKAIRLDPDFAHAYWEMGMTFSQRSLEGYRKKADALRRAIELSDRLSPQDRWILRADYHSMTRYRYAQALEAYQQWLRLAPDDARAHWGLGALYYDIEEWDKAAREFEFVIKSVDDSPSAYLTLARTYTNPGWYDKAEKVLNVCLDRKGENLSVSLALAGVLQCQGNYDGAHRVIRRTLAQYPRSGSCLAAEGDVFFYSGDFKRAEGQYQKLLNDKRPDCHALGLDRMAGLRLVQGRFKEARELTEQAVDRARRRGDRNTLRDRLSLLATLDALTGRPQEAIEKWDELWETTLQDEELEWQRFIVYSKGLLYAETGQLDLALKEAKKLEDLVAKGVDKKKKRLLLHLLAVVELKRKNYTQAVKHLEESLPMISARSRLNMAVANTLAEAYFRTGDINKAQQQYERMAAFPRGRDFYGNLFALRLYHLAKCHEAQGQPDLARRCYQQFLTLWQDADQGIPEVAEASKRLAELKSH
ncbi:MAG: tetratricopeptide repeat protein [Pirellulales bacterium]|nr:tetratricopeptide repeat protein [Pirellulales bacterium]